MPLVAVLHSPFYPIEKTKGDLHYFCDVIKVPRGTHIHHHEALALVLQGDRSLPLFGQKFEAISMSAMEWCDHLCLLSGRVLLPNTSLFIPARED